VTADEFRAACVLDARTAYAHFESMQTVELLRLQIAHQVDQAEAISPEAIAFGGGRLALIAAVLKKRGVAEQPSAGRAAGSTAYYAHLDTCRQCREYPFDQCATGAALLRAAADASDRP
jgi:hypothetical protein